MIYEHLPYSTAFRDYSDALIRGEYRLSECLAIHLNVEQLKASNRYEEVYWHECTHLQLTTSTTWGHALMFLQASGLLQDAFFSNLFSDLMQVCLEAQEGAAYFTQWSWHNTRHTTSTLDAFRVSIPAECRTPFDIFNAVATTILHQDFYWMRGIAANATGQFLLNTSILEILQRAFQGRAQISTTDYFGKAENHPHLRRIALMNAFGPPLSDQRTEVCADIGHRLVSTGKELALEFPHLFIDRTVRLGDATQKEKLRINDAVNHTLLVFFREISGLPLSAEHSREAGEQYDTLICILEQQSKQDLSSLKRYDMSRSLEARDKFRPMVKDVTSGELVDGGQILVHEGPDGR